MKGAPDGIDEELRHHLEARAARLESEGWSPDEARAEARRRFGDPRSVEAAVRREERIGRWTMRWKQWLDGVRSDVRVGTRQWFRTPGVGVLALLTLALGIGATTAIFSLVDGILLRPLPFHEPDRLVALWADWTERGGPEREWWGYANLHDIRTEVASLQEVGVYSGWRPTLLERGDPIQLAGAAVTAGMLREVLRVTPVRGRAFLDEEDVPGGPAVVVVSHAFWTETLGGQPGVVGQTINLDGSPWEIVGVLPRGFSPPLPFPAEVFSPLQLDAAERQDMRGNASFRALARMAPGVSVASTQEELTALATRLEEQYPEHNTSIGFRAVGLRDDLVASTRSGLTLVLAAVGLILLLACVNVANLLLARNSTREASFALREALGSGRRRIVRLLLVETGLLAAAGGILGVGLGVVGTRALVALAPRGTPRIESVSTDGRVLAVAVAVTGVAALLVGLLPALKMKTSDLRRSLVGGGRGASSSGAKLRLRAGLVVLQVGMAVALLGTAGILARSFSELRSVDLGFRPGGVMTFFVGLQGDGYAAPESRMAFYDELIPRLQALPGVEAAGGVNSLPLAGFDGDITFQAEDAPIPPPGQRRAAWIRRVTPDYMETLGLQVVAGRGIEAGDQRGGLPVAVINQTAADTHFPDEDPLGQRVALGDPEDPLLLQVVGVVADIRNFGVRDDFRSAVYIGNRQYPSGSLFLALRAADGVDPNSLVPGLRGAVAELDPTLAVSNVQALEDMVAEALGPDRFLAVLLGGFAALALILAVVGLYGVVSYSVGARVRELGVRIALGADAGTIRTRVILASMLPVSVGVVLGLALAWVGSRFTETLLYRVSPVDPVSLSWTVLVLLVTACAAAAIPATRAARVDPMTVLREE